jgi:hypothetical protein
LNYNKRKNAAKKIKKALENTLELLDIRVNIVYILSLEMMGTKQLLKSYL